MNYHWFPRLVALLLMAVLSSSAHSQTLPAERQKLASYQSQLNTLLTEQAQLQNTIEARQTEIANVRSKPAPGQDKLVKAQSAVAKAEQAYQADPSATNKSKLSNAEFKLALQERKYNKSNTELSALEDEMASLKNQSSNNEAEIARLKTTIKQQETQITVVQAQQQEQARVQQQQAIEQEKIRAQQAAAKMQREKALIAQQVAAEQAAATAAIAAATATADKQALEKKDEDVIYLGTRAAIAAEEQRLLGATANASGKQYNKILNIKPILADGSSGEVESNTLRTLGNDQYRGNASLRAGKVQLIIGFNRWEYTFSKAAEYTFIFDGSNPQKPRLVYFEEVAE